MASLGHTHKDYNRRECVDKCYHDTEHKVDVESIQVNRVTTLNEHIDGPL